MRPFFIATILPGVVQPTQSDAEATDRQYTRELQQDVIRRLVRA